MKAHDDVIIGTVVSMVIWGSSQCCAFVLFLFFLSSLMYSNCKLNQLFIIKACDCHVRSTCGNFKMAMHAD